MTLSWSLFPGHLLKNVILGGDWIPTGGEIRDKVAFSRSGFEAQAFEMQTEENRLVLRKTHDIELNTIGDEIYVENDSLENSVTIFDERFLGVPIAMKQGEALQGILNLGELPPGSYYLNGYMVSEDETFMKRFYVQFQVGAPKLELLPVKTSTDLMAHSPAKPYLETRVTNTGDAPITIYPIAIFVDKRTGEEITTEHPDDPYEANFTLPDGTTQSVMTIVPGDTVSVKVALEIDPDPLTTEKDELLTLQRDVKSTLSLEDLDRVQAKVIQLRDSAVQLAERAIQSRRGDLTQHLKQEKTEDLRTIVQDLRGGIQSVTDAIVELENLEIVLERAESAEEIVRLAGNLFGHLGVALNQASNGVYGVRLALVDAATDRSKGVYLGDRGIIAQTDHLVYEVNTEGSIERKVENYINIQEEIQRAQAGLQGLEFTLAKQSLGMGRQVAELTKMTHGEWVGPMLQSVNAISDGLSNQVHVHETDRLLEEAFREELGEDIWEMRGDFERKSWPHFFRAFRPLVKLFVHRKDYADIETEQIRKLSDPDAFRALEKRAIEKVRTYLTEENATDHMAYLDLVSLQRDLVTLDEAVSAVYSEYDTHYGITTEATELEKIEALQKANHIAGDMLEESGGIQTLFGEIKEFPFFLPFFQPFIPNSLKEVHCTIKETVCLS